MAIHQHTEPVEAVTMQFKRVSMLLHLQMACIIMTFQINLHFLIVTTTL
jgi:hypothetical protein